MAWVTPNFIEKWTNGQLVGPDTPHAVVQVQKGKWGRGYQDWPGPLIRANIYGEPHAALGTLGTGGFWRATWIPFSDWITIPNIVSIKRTRDFTQKGVTILELVVDATDYENKVGALGDAYHVVSPGFLAPLRGYVAPTRPDPGWSDSEFDGVLFDGVKIRVWQGLGPPVPDPDTSNPPTSGGDNGTWTFAGQIDDVDPDAGDSGGAPNSITITARNGKLLTDQKLFGWTKSQHLPDPIIFYDDLAADTLSMVGFQALAIDHENNYPPSNVLDRPKNPWNVSDPAYDTTWRGPAGAADDMQWLQIRLPQGKYAGAWLFVPSGISGVVAYVGIYAKNQIYRTATISSTDGGATTEVVLPPTEDGVDIPVGWVAGPTVPGSGSNPWSYFRFVPVLDGGGDPRNIIQFFHEFELGHGSILRLGFTNLPTIDGAPRMEVADLHGRHRQTSREALTAKYITVPDASDVVRVALRWCGYTDWIVEDAGVRLNGRLIFNRTQNPMDIIDAIATATGFVFMIADPVDGNSDGIPTFRRDSSLLVDNTYIAADLRDDGNLTGGKPKSSDENRVFIIRVRGTSAPASKDIPGQGVALDYGGGFVSLGGDPIKRIMAAYLPPWGNTHAGVLRRIIHQDNNLNTYAQCVMACYLIALSAGLQLHTFQCSLPSHPLIELDDQVTVLDQPSGTNSRLWVTNIADTMTLGVGGGETAVWTMTLEGALIDTPEFQAVLADLATVDWAALAAVGEAHQPPLPSPIQIGVERPSRTRTPL